MKISLLAIAAIAQIVSAAPSTSLSKRQGSAKGSGGAAKGSGGATANDLINGGCKKVTLIFARASTEPGNMGMSMGPATCNGLKGKLGAENVACQGVGGAYSAGLADNVSASGTTAGAIAEATKMFTQAQSKCPNTLIVAGGYSQGTAVMMNTISKLPEDLKAKVLGVVLFGYTKNGQQKGSIPNYPKDKVKVFCSASDGVCDGKLNVTAGHFSYMADGSGPKAVEFLMNAINSAGKGGESSAPAAAESSGEAASEAPAPDAASSPKGGRGRPKGSKGGAKGLGGSA